MPNSKILFSGLARQLAAQGLISESAIQTALTESAANKISFIVYLVHNKLISAKTIAIAAAHDFGISLLDLSALNPEVIPKNLVSKKIIQAYHAIPIFKRGEQLFIAISDPTNQAAIDEIKFHTGLRASPILVEEDKLQHLIDRVIALADDFSNSQLTDADLENLSKQQNETENSFQAVKSEQHDAPVVRFVNKILLEAIHKNASDIHFEPYEGLFRIRLRIDGILYPLATPPLNMASRIISRVKVMAELDIAERRLPQDGRLKLHINKKHAVDFRVSTCPTVAGEKAVMRILNSTSASLDIDKLGFEPKQKAAFLKAIQKAQGMVLVTGPTGSGKTVSLYTALNILNTNEVNICTVEDPVEINLPGINQVQINIKANLSFATALRAFLRQDPDIIMVGEIRDLETAEIGIKAAQTGHLVLSTLHTNSAPETLTRWLNMGISPFNIATSVTLIVAQRLVRKLCEICKQEEKIPTETLLAEGFTSEEVKSLKVFGPKGCDDCTAGYQGRTGIYEVLPVTESIGQIIMAGGTSFDIASLAYREGMQTLRQSGLNKIRQGITSLEEVNRITKD